MNANYVPRGHTRHEVLTAAMSSTAPNASSMAKPPRITNKVGTQEGIRFGGGWPVNRYHSVKLSTASPARTHIATMTFKPSASRGNTAGVEGF